MMLCSVYIASSVDGFIARPDGDVEWLHRPEYTAVPFNGLQYEEFIASVDTLVMGRHSFEKVVSFEPWPYENTAVVVLSSQPDLAIPAPLQDKVRVMRGEATAVVAQLAAEGK